MDFRTPDGGEVLNAEMLSYWYLKSSCLGRLVGLAIASVNIVSSSCSDSL